jgi:hypothetical protein
MSPPPRCGIGHAAPLITARFPAATLPLGASRSGSNRRAASLPLRRRRSTLEQAATTSRKQHSRASAVVARRAPKAGGSKLRKQKSGGPPNALPAWLLLRESGRLAIGVCAAGVPQSSNARGGCRVFRKTRRTSGRDRGTDDDVRGNVFRTAIRRPARAARAEV